jgi:hypothetical protein
MIIEATLEDLYICNNILLVWNTEVHDRTVDHVDADGLIKGF